MFCNDWKGKKCLTKIYDFDKYWLSSQIQQFKLSGTYKTPDRAQLPDRTLF